MGIAAAVLALIAYVGEGLAALIASRLLMFLAIKAILLTLVSVILPIIVNNILQAFLDKAFDYVNTVVTTDTVSGFNGAMTFTGFFAWLLDCLQVQGCVSIIISAFSIHLFLKMMPFSPFR
nr:hypothetical protein [uncultured Desulfuromonas sp.]